MTFPTRVTVSTDDVGIPVRVCTGYQNPDYLNLLVLRNVKVRHKEK